MKLLIAGGAGFIGSHFVRLAMKRWPGAGMTVLDKLTYAGNVARLDDVASHPAFSFVRGDICDPDVVRPIVEQSTHVINFAAETHVDRSILDPRAFIRTDVEGTHVLLEAASEFGIERYLQVSTDEVYGHVEPPGAADESYPARPRSPYSASKAAGDHLVYAYHVTYGVPTLLTRGSNTYGPYQYPEKLIPLAVTNAIGGLQIPVYGDGLQIRDWLSVHDHCTGIATVLERGTPGEAYNLGAGAGRTNLDVLQRILDLIGADRSLLRHVEDRAGHDRRYALDSSKAVGLGWGPTIPFEEGLGTTVDWYQQNRSWWMPIRSGDFVDYYRAQYAHRL